MGYLVGMNVLFIFLLIVSTNAHALTYEVVGACDSKPVFQGNLDFAGIAKSVGAASIEIFERDKIPYIGAENGMNSILGTPTGMDAIEVINREELRAYGWCYEVDGRQPTEMPDQLILQGGEHLRWFYAFSLNRRNEWVSYCDPAFVVKPEALCGKP